MTSQGRQDLIAIVCAFIGAGVVRRVVPPFEGVPPVFMSIAGAALGLMAARMVFTYLKIRETKAALQRAEDEKAQNDAAFSATLYDEDERDPK